MSTPHNVPADSYGVQLVRERLAARQRRYEAHALGLALVAHQALRAYRRGVVSHLKNASKRLEVK